MELKKLKVDEDIANDGVWFQYYEDFWLKIASTEVPEYRKNLPRRMRIGGRGFRDGTPPPETLELIQAELFSKYIVRDWKGLQIDGKDVKHSQKKCYEILSDKQYRHLLNFVAACSSDVSEFVKEETEDALGNSKASSNST